MKNRKFFVLISCVTLLCLWLYSCTLQQAKSVTLTVSALPIAKEALTEINKIYKQKKTNITIDFNFAISDLLRQQIEQGLPADIFISASSIIMDDLQTKGFLIAETRQNLIRNNLALIVPLDSKASISNFKDLTRDQVKKVALARGKLVAATYTKETLDFLEIYELVQKKGVFTEDNGRSILTAVEAKKVDAGITYSSEAKLSNQVKIVAVAPENTHSPIIYPIAVIKSCQHVPEAKDYIQFLKSDQAKAIFEKYGYTTIN